MGKAECKVAELDVGLSKGRGSNFAKARVTRIDKAHGDAWELDPHLDQLLTLNNRERLLLPAIGCCPMHFPPTEPW